MIDLNSSDIEILLKRKLIKRYIKVSFWVFFPISLLLLVLILYEAIGYMHKEKIAFISLLILGLITMSTIWIMILQARKKRSILILLNHIPFKIDLLGLDKLREYRLEHLERVKTREKGFTIPIEPTFQVVFTHGNKKIRFVFKW